MVTTSVLALIAVVISSISLFVAKRQVIASVITKTRIDWLDTIRVQLADFLEEYINQSDKIRLHIIKAKIEIQIKNDANIYKPLLAQINKCIENAYNESDYIALVNQAQILLDKIWERIKREAGARKKMEARLKNRLKQEFENKN